VDRGLAGPVTAVTGHVRGARPQQGITPAHTDIATLRAHLALVMGRPDPPAYRDLAAEYGVHHAVLWRILHDGYDPVDPTIRERLGLPVVQWHGVIYACAHCGRPFVPNVPQRHSCYLCRPIHRH